MPPASPGAAEIRRRVHDVLQRTDYQLDTSDSADLGDSFFVRALRWLSDGFTALAESLAFLPWFLRYPAALLIVVLVAWLVYRIVRALSRRVQDLVSEPGDSLRGRSVTIDDPVEYEALAAAARRDDRFVEAARWLLRAALLRLEHAEKRRPRPGATNRELLRRYRGTPLASPLQTMVDIVDVYWYGDRPAGLADFDRCQASYRQLHQALTERSAPLDQPPPTRSN